MALSQDGRGAGRQVTDALCVGVLMLALGFAATAIARVPVPASSAGHAAVPAGAALGMADCTAAPAAAGQAEPAAAGPTQVAHAAPAPAGFPGGMALPSCGDKAAAPAAQPAAAEAAPAPHR